MSDDNNELINQIAHRVVPPEPVLPEPYDDDGLPPTQVIVEWNAPIDTIQADSMSMREVIRGEIADAKERAARWQPRPCPD